MDFFLSFKIKDKKCRPSVLGWVPTEINVDWAFGWEKGSFNCFVRIKYQLNIQLGKGIC
jgi:hypothetical protein